MKSIEVGILGAACILFAIGCGQKDTKVVQELNISVSVDFSLSRGQDPTPFVKLLEPKLADLNFPIRKSQMPTGLGVVWVQCSDDNLTELYGAFQAALEETQLDAVHNPYGMVPSVSVRLPEPD